MKPSSSKEKPKSHSEILEEETLKMEAKLRVLKAEMAKQRAESEVYGRGEGFFLPTAEETAFLKR